MSEEANNPLGEAVPTKIQEVIFLSKFEGEALPENEFERIEIVDGQIVAVHSIENGQVVETKRVSEL